MKQAWALLLFAVLGASRAAAPAPEQSQTCSEATIAKVGAHFKIANFKLADEEGGVVMAAACKRWPADPQLEIAVFGYDAGKEEQKQRLTTIIDWRSGKVVSANVATIEEDAMMTLYGAHFRIDTARYDLAPGVRAFGVDLASGYVPHYCPEGGVGDIRTLYVREGEKIRPVLEDLTMSTWSYADGTFKGCGEQAENAPDPVTRTVSLALAIAKTSSKGYADLEVTASTGFDNGAKSTTRPRRQVLHYDGKRYPIGETGLLD